MCALNKGNPQWSGLLTDTVIEYGIRQYIVDLLYVFQKAVDGVGVMISNMYVHDTAAWGAPERRGVPFARPLAGPCRDSPRKQHRITEMVSWLCLRA